MAINKKNILITILCSLILSMNAYALSESTLFSKAIAHIKANYTFSKNLKLFAVSNKELKLSSGKSIISVITADTVPLIKWNVVIDHAGKAENYNYKKIKPFNEFLAKEKILLRDKKSYSNFIIEPFYNHPSHSLSNHPLSQPVFSQIYGRGRLPTSMSTAGSTGRGECST